MKKCVYLALVVISLIVLTGCPKQIVNQPSKVTVETVLVEAGTFNMGDEFEDLSDYCRPVHQVTLTNNFELGKYETTNQEYVEFLNDREVDSDGRYNGKVLIPMNYFGCQIGHNAIKFYVKNQILNDHPVISVTWWGAIEYCNWLSERTGYAKAYNENGEMLDEYGNVTTNITEVKGYRLPTEAEWEFAARGGTNHSSYKYSGSDNPDEVAWYDNNSANPDNQMSNGKGTHKIGSKQPNILGIYDMSGNAYEWCSDSYVLYFDSVQTNPCIATGSYRVLRGGSWLFDTTYARIAYRCGFVPTDTDFNLGFRFCRTVN